MWCKGQKYNIMSTHINKRQSLISLSFLSLKEKNLRLTLSKRKLEAIEARLDEDSSRSFFISESWWSGVGDEVEWDHKLFLLDKTPPACLRMMMKMIAMMIIQMNRKLEDVVGTHRMLLSCWGEEFEDALYMSGCVTIWCHTDLLATATATATAIATNTTTAIATATVQWSRWQWCLHVNIEQSRQVGLVIHQGGYGSHGSLS